MLAQKRYEVAKPTVVRPRRRRRVGLLRKVFCNRMVCVLLFALGALFVLSVYVGAYAKATETGYQRGELLTRLKAVKLENEQLRLKLEELRQPERIATFAVANGMEQGTSMMYIRAIEQSSIARNPD